MTFFRFLKGAGPVAMIASMPVWYVNVYQNIEEAFLLFVGGALAWVIGAAFSVRTQ